MRSVIKGHEPESFASWKAGETAEWVPSYDILQKPEKLDLLVALIAEQEGSCCYCGRIITADDSHIEHFEPQERAPSRALEFANLHASCIRGSERGDPLHCGHGKGNAFEPHRVIAPTDVGCEARFSYNRYTGAVAPTEPDDDSAHYMIGLLKLDIGFLRIRRREALEGMFDDDFEATATISELERLAEQATTTDPEGRRVAFGHVLARHARALIALKRQAA